MEPESRWLETASRAEKWLCGVSGGLDSMALLHLLNAKGFKEIVVCHLDHGLRGIESGGDARFVENAAREMGYDFELGTVDLRSRMKQTGESLETAGRLARHQFFGACAEKHGCWNLLLAHHADDQAETVLWNLLRGSHGCRGMREITGIRMNRAMVQVIRPLLDIRKSWLEKWMKGNFHVWREDASNSVNDVVRNRMRNEALPLLADIARRDVVPMLNEAACVDEEWRGLLSWAVEQAHARDPQGRIHLKAFRELPLALQRGILVDYLRENNISGVSSKLVEQCLELQNITMASSVNLPGGSRLRRREGRIFIDKD
ncbi:tRNA lysidine(34) synthetase TilS [Luteolibacter algae]|uniref:tRNA(Ile)-lysidine synthase n=1 Tax=Luteolibacter algae TaxID=454151 RepID=A0ABW5D8P2_9BACT